MMHNANSLQPISTHNIKLYKCYNTLPITDLHSYQILLFVHKFIHHKQNLPDIFALYFTENSFIYDYNTRSKSNLHVRSIQSQCGKRLTTYKGSILWNNLPDSLKLMHSTSEFKENLSHLLYSG